MEFWFLSFHVSNNSRCLGLTGGKVPSCSSRAVPFPSCLWMWCTLKLGVLKQFYTLGLACKVIQSCVFLFAFTRGRFRLWARVQEDDLIVNSQPSSLPHGDSHCAPAMPLSDKHWKNCKSEVGAVGFWKLSLPKSGKKKTTVCVKTKKQTPGWYQSFNPSTTGARNYGLFKTEFIKIEVLINLLRNLYSPIAAQHNVGKFGYNREYSCAQLFISSASAELQEVLALSWAHQFMREELPQA